MLVQIKIVNVTNFYLDEVKDKEKITMTLAMTIYGSFCFVLLF